MLAKLWRILTLSARVIFACRVSVLSALAGLVLFGLVLQAQNLFADLSFSGWADGALYWGGFFLAVFLIWAFPIHYGARAILSEDGWLVAGRFRRALPERELKQLQQNLRKEMAGLIDWLPRILGILPFVAVGLGLYSSFRAMDGARALPDAEQARRQIVALGLADAITAALFIAFVCWRRPWLDRLKMHFDGPKVLRMGKGPAELLLYLLAVFSLVVTALAFLVAYFWPHALATAIPRALLAPYLFGSLVLVLSWLVRRGYQWGVPLLAPILILCLVITATNRHFNDLRLLPVKDPVALDQRQIDVKEAVSRWRAANGCSGDDCPAALIVAAEGGASRAAFMEATLVGEIIDRTRGAADLAPGRKIFAISGVSGGAFGGAAIRAALADASEAGGAPPCRAAPRTWFGAGKSQAAGLQTSWRSCLQALVAGDFLSEGVIGLGFRDNFAPREWFVGHKSWIDDRAALLEQSWERHYNYVVGGQGPLFQTGAACGEDSDKGLCRRFGYVEKKLGQEGWLPLLLLNGTSVETGRRIIASDLISTMKVTDQENGKVSRLPLYSEAFDLFELLSTPCADQGHSCPLGPAYPDDRPEKRDAKDLRLSTAALISARFPIISPAGVLRTPGDGRHGDRVVDGGYFENAGLTSALDLAEAIHREGVHPAILWVQNEPVGAGDVSVTPPRPVHTPVVGRLDESFTSRGLGILASPVDALIATRQGHGAEAAGRAVPMLDSFNGWRNLGYFSIGVRQQAKIEPPKDGDPDFAKECGDLVALLKGRPLAMTKVSMSWWLSAAVQADLDAQICDSDNRIGINALVKLLEKGK